jgi:hypothetical protein
MVSFAQNRPVLNPGIWGGPSGAVKRSLGWRQAPAARLEERFVSAVACIPLSGGGRGGGRVVPLVYRLKRHDDPMFGDERPLSFILWQLRGQDSLYLLA